MSHSVGLNVWQLGKRKSLRLGIPCLRINGIWAASWSSPIFETTPQGAGAHYFAVCFIYFRQAIVSLCNWNVICRSVIHATISLTARRSQCTHKILRLLVMLLALHIACLHGDSLWCLSYIYESLCVCLYSSSRQKWWLLNSLLYDAGQLFIVHTIQSFGPLLFATVMTSRQFATILLSCLIFHHPLSKRQWCVWQSEHPRLCLQIMVFALKNHPVHEQSEKLTLWVEVHGWAVQCAGWAP